MNVEMLTFKNQLLKEIVISYISVTLFCSFFGSKYWEYYNINIKPKWVQIIVHTAFCEF